MQLFSTAELQETETGNFFLQPSADLKKRKEKEKELVTHTVTDLIKRQNLIKSHTAETVSLSIHNEYRVL